MLYNESTTIREVVAIVKTIYFETTGKTMKTHELVVEMKMLERRLTPYEEKYGILSEDFYHALMSGELAHYDDYDETRADFSRWKGIYETWQRRKNQYDAQIKEQKITESLRFQPAY